MQLRLHHIFRLVVQAIFTWLGYFDRYIIYSLINTRVFRFIKLCNFAWFKYFDLARKLIRKTIFNLNSMFPVIWLKSSGNLIGKEALHNCNLTHHFEINRCPLPTIQNYQRTHTNLSCVLILLKLYILIYILVTLNFFWWFLTIYNSCFDNLIRNLCFKVCYECIPLVCIWESAVL